MNLKIVFLGTSAAVPTLERSLPAIAYVWKGEILLFDAGEGVQRQMLKAGLSILKVKKVFITHNHGDHVIGLLGLIHTMSMYGRTKDLEIYGPKSVWNFLKESIETIGHDPQYRIVFRSVNEGTIVDEEDYAIKAFKVDHGGIEAYGYVFEEKKRPGKLDVKKLVELGVPQGPLWKMLQEGKDVVLENGRVVKWRDVVKPEHYKIKVVYTGDTKPVKNTIEASKNATVLIHDGTFDSSKSKEAHEQGHSTASDAARIAAEANVDLLVLTHISARYKNPEILLDEAKRIFERTTIAYDFLTIILF